MKISYVCEADASVCWWLRSLAQSVLQTALDVRQSVFGGINLHVAVAHEDLAYASYVHNYALGKFNHARLVNMLFFPCMSSN